MQWVEPAQDLQLNAATWPRVASLTSPAGTLEFMLLPSPVARIPEAASLRGPLRGKDSCLLYTSPSPRD
eukprot:1170683-Alexandrium_andersonii.AAC.1